MRVAVTILALFAGLLLVWWITRRFADRLARRAALRFRTRIDRYKLARRRFVRERLIGDPDIAAAVREHARENGVSEAEAWRKVHGYITEIVPFFNIVAYYQIGYRVAKVVLRLFYNVTVEHEDGAAPRRPPRDAVLIYLMNHRSNRSEEHTSELQSPC